MARDNDITDDTGATRTGSTRDDRTMTDGTRDDRTMTDGTRDDRTMVTDGTRHQHDERRARPQAPCATTALFAPTATGTASRTRSTCATVSTAPRSLATTCTASTSSTAGSSGAPAFFGWLSAMGFTVLLVAIASAAGVALGYTAADTDASNPDAETVGLVGAIVLLVIIGLGYYAGGYVAGRMARFDGARQGVGVWIIGLLVTVGLAVAGWAFGSEYNVLSDLNMPRIPVEEGDATTAGIIALAAVLLVTLFAAISGGKVGERYHRKVDRAGIDA